MCVQKRLLYILLLIFSLLTTLFMYGVREKYFSTLQSYSATSSPSSSNVSLMTYDDTSSRRHHVTRPLKNETPPTTAPLLSSTTSISKTIREGCNTTITIVSAFFDIGNHKKGGGNRKMDQYFEWSKAFGFIWNPLYFYTDSSTFAEHLKKVRSSLNDNLTHIFHINRSSLWPFKLHDAIAQLYRSSSYPKHHPNTVVPDYSCAMHSKYACVQSCILNSSGEMNATFYAWIDIGYFRNLHPKNDYCISLPNGINSDKVMFNQVYKPNFNLTPKQIYYGNHVWVGGGMFIAARDTMLRFCSEYRRAVEFFLFSRNLSSTDQQCLYASYTKSGRLDINMTVELQVFEANGEWFKLGTSNLRRLDL